MSPTRTRSLLGTLAIVVCLLASSCGVKPSADGVDTFGAGGSALAGGSGGDALAFLQSAAEATGKAGPLDVALDLSITGTGQDDVKITASGQVDADAKKGHLTMDLGALGAELGDGAGTFEAILDGDTTYLKSPIFGQLTGSTKPWVKIDAATLAGDGSTPSTTLPTDPADLVALLGDAVGPLRQLGTEEVDGDETRHVAIDVDLQALMANVMKSGPGADAMGELDGMGLETGDLPTLPIEAWVDGDGLLRRLRIVVDLSSMAGGDAALADAKVSMTVELSPLDGELDVSPPPASQVAALDPNELLGGMSDLGGGTTGGN